MVCNFCVFKCFIHLFIYFKFSVYCLDAVIVGVVSSESVEFSSCDPVSVISAFLSLL